jgi:AMIN domain
MKIQRLLGMITATICTCFLLGTSQGWAEEAHHVIETFHYNSHMKELTITTTDHLPLQYAQFAHHPQYREVVFFIPDTTLKLNPYIINVDNDPVISTIQAEQSIINGMPAVRVKVSLCSASPYLPLSLYSDGPNLRMVISSEAVTADKQPDPPSSLPQKAALPKEKPQPKVSSATATVYKASAAVTPIQTPQADTPPQQIETNPEKIAAEMQRIKENATQDLISDSVLGPVSQDEYSVINDIYFENNSLTIVSQKLPLTVKHSFPLTEPNRFVIDLSPAILHSKSQLRVIPENNPNIESFKTGQLDEKTVRIVVQFTKNSLPVTTQQAENNRILKLVF